MTSHHGKIAEIVKAAGDMPPDYLQGLEASKSLEEAREFHEQYFINPENALLAGAKGAIDEAFSGERSLESKVAETAPSIVATPPVMQGEGSIVATPPPIVGHEKSDAEIAQEIASGDEGYFNHVLCKDASIRPYVRIGNAILTIIPNHIAEGSEAKIYKGAWAGKGSKPVLAAVKIPARASECETLKVLGDPETGNPAVTKYFGQIEQNVPKEFDHRYWLSMEWLSGAKLLDVLAKLKRSLTSDETATIADAVLCALEGAHSNKIKFNGGPAKTILHRDIKPENIFITSDGRVILTDWGLTEGKLHPQTGQQERTAVYASAQQVFCETPYEVDVRSDINSAGAALYRGRTNRGLPFIVGSKNSLYTDLRFLAKSNFERGKVPIDARDIQRSIRGEALRQLEKRLNEDPHKREGKLEVRLSDFYYPHKDFAIDTIIGKMLTTGRTESLDNFDYFDKVFMSHEQGYTSASKTRKDLKKVFDFLSRYKTNDVYGYGASLMRDLLAEASVSEAEGIRQEEEHTLLARANELAKEKL